MAKRRRRQTLIQRSRAVSPQTKATYHTATGAGASKTKRQFFDVGREDADAITALLSTRLDRNLQRGS
jgi:hypothetical protein